jgi:hypothetical protein
MVASANPTAPAAPASFIPSRSRGCAFMPASFPSAIVLSITSG